MRALKVALVLTLVAISSQTVVAQDFDNTDATNTWQTSSQFGNVGSGHVLSTNAANTFLNGFSFWVGSGGPMSFRAHLAVLGAGGTTYTDIWTSAVISPSLPYFGGSAYNLNLSAFSRLDFGVGMALDPTLMYSAYLRPTSGTTLLHAIRTKTGNGSIDNSDYWQTRWNTTGSGFHLDGWESAFAADYGHQVVPEPATMLLLVTGLVGVAGFGYRRRKRDA